MSGSRLQLTLHDQFVISRAERPVPADFTTTEFDGWVLQSGPALPVSKLYVDGRESGWLLGWALDTDATFSFEHGRADLDSATLETDLFRHRGRWTAFLTTPSARVYVDPGASLGTVYRVGEEVVGSTTTAVSWGRPEAAFGARFAAHDRRANEFGIAGLTSDPTIRRCIPNHVLDVATSTLSRHWPDRYPAPMDPSEVPAAIARIAADLRTLIESFARLAPLALPLTSGVDSRALLAAARNVLERVRFVTFDYAGDFRHADSDIAVQLAARFGLEHQIVPLRPATEEEQIVFLESIGYDASAGKARDFLVGGSQVPGDYGWMTGFMGELGRGIYWRSDNSSLTAEELLRRLPVRGTPEELSAIREWLAGIPDLTDEQLLDLFFLEVRMGGWVSPQLYGTAPFAFNVLPFSQRDIIATTLALPVDYRRKGLNARDLAMTAWPELAEVPYLPPDRRFRAWRRRLRSRIDVLRGAIRRLRAGSSR